MYLGLNDRALPVELKRPQQTLLGYSLQPTWRPYLNEADPPVYLSIKNRALGSLLRLPAFPGISE